MTGGRLRTRLLATILPLPISLFLANSDYFVIENVSSLLMAVFISLLFQELFCRYFFFKEENMDMSRRLGEVERLIQYSSQYGPIFVSILVLFSPFLFAAIFLSIIEFIAPGGLDLTIGGWVILCLSLGLLIDPLIPTFLESSVSESVTYLTGYLSIVLIGFGAISNVDIGLFQKEISDQFLICIALLNVRITYTVELGYKHRPSITSFAPSVVALFVAVAPNILEIFPRL